MIMSKLEFGVYQFLLGDLGRKSGVLLSWRCVLCTVALHHARLQLGVLFRVETSSVNCRDCHDGRGCVVPLRSRRIDCSLCFVPVRFLHGTAH